MSTGSTPTTQTTTQVLSPQQQQLMDLAMPSISKYAATTPTRYPGETIAPFNANQIAGQAGAVGAAGTQDALAGSGAGTTQSWLNPNTLDAE